MPRRCVVYMRVSAPVQSVASSFIRQLESCTTGARMLGFYIKGIYADTCSGDSTMPNRSLAYMAAKHMDCPILVESQCRWSRKRPGTDPLVDVEVLAVGECSATHMCQRIYRESISAVELPRLTHVAR